LSGGWLAAYTDSDSDWGSLERRKLAAEMYRGGGVGVSVGTGRKPTPHKRTRKKRAAIPVATPRVPPFGDAASAMLSYRFKEDKGAFSAMSFLEIFPSSLGGHDVKWHGFFIHYSASPFANRQNMQILTLIPPCPS